MRLGGADVKRGMLLFATLQPPVTMNASWRYTIWRFPSLIAAPPRQHGLGSASFFRRSAGAIVCLGGADVKRGAPPMLLGLFLVPAVDRWLERFDT